MELTAEKRKNQKTFFLLLFGALALRLVLAPLITGFSTDIACWQGWSRQLVEFGIPNFYASTEFCDYPPGYMYILYLLGLLQNVVPSSIYLVLLKLPAIICDVLLGWFFFRMAKGEKLGLLVCALWLFNPASIMDSAVWGQVDSIFTLFLVLSLYQFSKKKFSLSAFLLGIAVLLKPQALMFGPVYLFYFIENKKDWKKALGCLGIGFVTVALLAIPFFPKITDAINLYTGTIGSYEYASVNAFNIFALLGENYGDLSHRFFYLTSGSFGVAAICFSLLYGLWFYMKAKDPSKLFYTPALIMSIIFTFGPKMHERYIFPVIALLLACYIMKRDKRVLYSVIGVSVAAFLNMAVVLAANYYTQNAIDKGNLLMLGTCVLMIATTLYMIYSGYKMYINDEKKVLLPLVTDPYRMGKKDYAIMLGLTAVFAFLGFFRLGDNFAPETGMVLERGQEVVLDLGESREVTRVLHFNGIGGENATYAISQDGIFYEPLAEIEDTYCYTWYAEKVKGQGRYIKITADDDNLNLLEAGFYSGTEKLAVSETPVTDEQSMVPYEKTYMNSMYFDEVYHARTAYEHVEGMWPYENTHPPLGKEFIALGIKTFGMNPFGWRFSGVLFAILMVPLMYLFGKKVFQRRDLAFLASFLITVDFMHLAHGRIATIDTYGVFFIILMYYFMYDFFMADLRRDRVRDHVWTLALGGLAFGLGIAAKWIGFYAAIGLVVMFFWSVGKLFNKNHWKKALCYIGLGTAFYAIIPFAIYYASYLPILNLENAGGFWSWQETMFKYHSQLTERHPFESAWYQWPFMGRPLWMFSGGVDENGITSTIVSFGNPAIWFLTIPALCGVAYLGKKLADKRAAFIIIGFLSQILPWVFISRSTFIYHFYACVPFVILALCFVLGRMKKKVMVIYCVVALALFVLYWPILTGADVWVPYANALRCFEGWTLSAQG